MTRFMSILIGLALTPLVVVAAVVAIVITALLSPLLELLVDNQPSKFYDYGKDPIA